MNRRGGRSPSEDEITLWRRVTETIAPLKAPLPLPEKAKDKEAPSVAKSAKAAPAPPAEPRPKRAAAPTLAPIERRMRTRLARGRAALDARLDLHGLTQAEAHRRLARFLAKAQENGATTVLVITGKGRAEAGDRSPERGVLRRVVPQWLAAADMRRLVVGFEAAAPRHGGDGALYVRVRRRRD